MKTDTSNMIKNLRKSRKLTQEQLGVLSGMTKSQISRMEKGTLGSPETVDRLLEAMGYSIELKIVDKYETPDGETVIPVTGGSVNGNWFDVQGRLTLSSESVIEKGYEGPLAVCMEDIPVAGE